MSLDIFFDQFAALADAPNGVKKLRELILQLAVQGKLVPQDPNDEPASVLLEKIRAEKAQSNGQRKLLDDETPKIDPRIVPYEIPATWVWVQLGEVGRIVGGGTPRTDNPQYYADNDIPWLTPADLYGLKEKFIGRGRRDISKLGLQESSAQLMPAGSVLFSSRAPIGYVAIASNDLATNQGFKSCVPFILEMNEYIYYYLKSAAKSIEARASGTTFKEVSGKDVSQVLFSLPPLNEQRRIVAKVDQLMALCDELEARQTKRREMRIKFNDSALDHLLAAQGAEDFAAHWQRLYANFDLLYDTPETIRELRQAILQLAVQGKLVPQDPNDESITILPDNTRVEQASLIEGGEIKNEKLLRIIEDGEVSFELPKGWLLLRLGEIASVVRGGSPRPAGDKTYYDGDIPFLKVADLTATDEIYLNTYTFTIKEAGLSRTRFVDANTLMLTNSGATLGIPKICTFSTTFNDGIAAFLDLSPRVDKVFLYYFLKSKSRWFLQEAARGQGQPNLNTGIIKFTVIGLPPVAEQRRIVAKVEQLMTMCDELEAKLKDAQAMSERLVEVVVRQVLVGSVTA